MANLEKFHNTIDNEVDQLFNLYLRPLKNFNARRIYEILYEKTDSMMTTLDIQRELNRNGISLDKKEINTRLKNLQKACLIYRHEIRGKPTTFNYRGKYSYDLWEITQKGNQIGKGLESLIKGRKSDIMEYLENSFWDYGFSGDDYKNNLIKTLEYAYVKLVLLKLLDEATEPLEFKEFSEKIIPSQTTLNEVILLGISDEFIKKSEKQSSMRLVEKLLAIIGIKKNVRTFSLTEKGRKLTSALIKPEKI